MPITFQCSCGKLYKVPDEAAGKKITCKECGNALKVPARAAKKKKKTVPDESDPFSMDFGLEDDPVPTALPPRKKKNSDGGKKKRKSAPAQQSSNTGLKVGIGVAVFLIAGVGAFFAVQSINSSGGGGGAAPAQVNYSNFAHELGGFKVKYPAEWEVDSGGGSGGRPPFASFDDGTARISIRDNPKGSSVGTMASLPAGGPIIPGEEVEEDPPAKSVHEFMGETVYSHDFSDFEELPGKEFKVPYGDGWLSEFTGKEGFGSKKKAYRLTLVGTQYQYNVICKCPQNKWDQYEPIFMEVLKSISR